MCQDDIPIKPTPGEKAMEAAAIAFNAIPYAGGVLSDVAQAVISRRQNRRLNEFLLNLANDLSRLKSSLNAEFLKTEDFHDLAEEVFGKAAETRQADKLQALRNLFVNTILSANPTYDEAAEIIRMLEGWQPRHIVLLRILADPIAADRSMKNAVGPGGGTLTSINQILRKLLPGWDEEQIDRTWNELHDARIHATRGTRAMMTDRGIHQLEGRLTEFGQRVAWYLTRQP
jgi:hypothetical protein